MGKKYLFYAPMAVALLLMEAATASAQGAPQGWTPRPWRQYLVRLEVERDTTSAPSILQRHHQKLPTVDLSRFSVGTFTMPESPSIFEGQEHWIGRENRRKGYVLGSLLEDMVNTLFHNI